MLEWTSQQAKKPGKSNAIHSPCCKIIGVSFSCVAFCDNSGQCNSRCYSQSVLKYSYIRNISLN